MMGALVLNHSRSLCIVWMTIGRLTVLKVFLHKAGCFQIGYFHLELNLVSVSLAYPGKLILEIRLDFHIDPCIGTRIE